MKGLVTWATDNARMIVALIIMSVVAGVYSYANLPKEGEPDISVPFLFCFSPLPRNFRRRFREAAGTSA